MKYLMLPLSAAWYLLSSAVAVLLLWPVSRRRISRAGLVILPEDAQ